MATIQTCNIKSHRMTDSGSTPATYEVMWNVRVDDRVSTKELLRLARTVAGSATITPVPFKGDHYSVSFTGGKDEDKGAIALDFQVDESLDDGLVYEVRVTYRAPALGEDEEPERVIQPPLKRPPYYWIEYYTETEEVYTARLPTTFRAEDTRSRTIGQGTVERRRGEEGPITTAAGEETDIATDERIHMVLCCQRNVVGPQVAARINATYEATINREPWKVPREFANLEGITLDRTRDPFVELHKARFLRAETGQFPLWWDGEPYFRMQVRVRIAKRRFYKNVPNTGTWQYLPSPDNRVEIIRTTDAVPRKGHLNSDGTLPGAGSELSKPIIIPYQISDDVKYASSVGFNATLPDSLMV